MYPSRIYCPKYLHKDYFQAQVYTFGYMDPFTRIASLMYLKYYLFLVSVITSCLWALMSVSFGRARMEMRGVETYFRV